MNLQVISAPRRRDPLGVRAPARAVHDLTAARIWGILRELAASGLIVLADKGYAGAGDHIRIPYRGRGKPASQKDANRAHAQLRSPGERANATAQDLAHPAQTPLLPLARRATGKSHPRPSNPRDRRMKKAQYIGSGKPWIPAQCSHPRSSPTCMLALNARRTAAICGPRNIATFFRYESGAWTTCCAGNVATVIPSPQNPATP